MKTIEDAKRFLEVCDRVKGKDNRWDDGINTNYDSEDGSLDFLCSNICCECTTPDALRWVWPELKEDGK